MADIRTLKLQLLADTAQFSTGLNKAESDTESFSNKIGDTVKKAALAFAALTAAAGAAAIKIGIDSVKAAIEDEKAQASLAQTLRNTVKATDAQIKATEAYIDTTQRAVGVSDDQLRPSLQRLLVSTNDLAKAQKLQSLALDVAAGSGKSLQEVSDILAKAYDGNYKALKNLGVELKTTNTYTKTLKVSKADLEKQSLDNESATLRVQAAQERLNKVLNNGKSDALDIARAQNALEKAQLAAASASDKYEESVSKQGKTVKVTKEENVSFDEIIRQLSDNFKGQAAIAAETFSGRIERVKIALSEAKETLGQALLPILEKFVKFATDSLIPAIEDFIAGLTGGQPNSVKNALRDVKGRVVDWKESLNEATGDDATGAYGLGKAVRDLATEFGRFNGALSGANGETGLKAFIDNMTKLLDIVNKLIAPFAALAEFSNNFAQSQSQARIELPSIVTGASSAVGSAVDRGINNISVNISGVVGDKTSVARTVTKAITSAAKQGTVNKLARLNLR